MREVDPRAGDEALGTFDRRLLEEGMTSLYLSPVDRKVLEGFRRLYLANHPAEVEPDEEPRIPRILHQIWIGGGPMPERFRRFRRGWIDHHPGWEHRLWTDAEVAELDFASRDLYDATDDLGMKSDILRAEIIRRFGGLYVDVDYECRAPFDLLHYRYDFYGTLRAGLGAHVVFPTIFPSPLVACTSAFAAIPEHPFPGAYLEKVRRLWPRRDEIRLGWWRAETWLAGRRRPTLLRTKRTAKVTYQPFGSAVVRHFIAGAGRGERAVFLPPSWLNPVDTWWGANRYASPTFWWGLLRRAARGEAGIPPHYERPFRHSMAVHHSSASWL